MTEAGLWLPAKGLAVALEVTETHVRNNLIPRLRPSDVDREARPRRFRLRAVAEVLFRRRRTDEDEALYGPATPNLERWRRIRADREQLALDRERQELIPRTEARQIWELGIATLHRFVGRVENRCPGAAADWQTVADETLRQVQRLYANESAAAPCGDIGTQNGDSNASD